MTINYSPLLQLAEPVTGTESGTWGDVVNQQITLLTEAAIAGATTITFTSTDVTLTTTTGSGGNQSRSAILLLAGSPASGYNLIGPGTSKIYLIRNATGQTITVKASGTTGIALATGTTSWVFWNGSDYALAGPTITTSTGAVPIATGVGGLGSGVATFLATPSSANLATAVSDETGTGALVFATGPALSGPSLTSSTRELTQVAAGPPSSTQNIDVSTGLNWYYTANNSANWTFNFRGNSGTALNSVMSTGDTVTVTIITTNGSTAYYASAITIDGSAVTPKYQGSAAYSSGHASSLDVYTYAITKTASATFTVLASQTQFV